MQKRFYLVLVVVIAAALLAACGGSTSGGSSGQTAAPSGGDAKKGETTFKQTVIGSQPGCVTCHSLDGSKLVGPSMQGIGSRAGNAVSGKSADDYLHESILQPNAHVVEGYTQGIMPSYQGVLNDQQLNDVIAYLKTL